MKHATGRFGPNGDNWELLLYVQPVTSDLLYTLQRMPEGEHALKQIIGRYKEIFGEELRRADANDVVTSLGVAELVTFRRSGGLKEPEKYVRLTERGVNVRF